MAVMVACEDIHKTYRQGKVDVHAVKGLTLSIEQGEFTAVAGPSGSGKTTVLNLMGGLDTVDSGSVVVDGNRLPEMREKEIIELRLRKIGFIFQSYNLIPVLSALENVEYVMMLQGVEKKAREARAKKILDEIGLSGMYHRRPAALSGGQQQRVAVARAVVSDPSIVLADEPTANLDSKTGRNLLEMMREMNEKRGVTFIFSTHDDMVMEFARRLVHIRDGRVDGEERR